MEVAGSIPTTVRNNKQILTVTKHLCPVMFNRIGTVYPSGSKNGFIMRFCVDSPVGYETPEEGRKVYII